MINLNIFHQIRFDSATLAPVPTPATPPPVPTPATPHLVPTPTPPPEDCVDNDTFISPPLYASTRGAPCTYFCNSPYATCEDLISVNYPNSPSYGVLVRENCPSCCATRCSTRRERSLSRSLARSLAQMFDKGSSQNTRLFTICASAGGVVIMAIVVFLGTMVYGSRTGSAIHDAPKSPYTPSPKKHRHARLSSLFSETPFEGDMTILSPPSSKLRREMNGIPSPPNKS